MIEEIRSLVRCHIEDFGHRPEYLIIGQDQFNRFYAQLSEYHNFARINNDRYLGLIGNFEGLNVVIVTSDILEVV